MLGFTAPEARTELVQAPYASVLEHTSSALQLRRPRPGLLLLAPANHGLSDVAARTRRAAHDGSPGGSA
jgi:hypothetical protein